MGRFSRHTADGRSARRSRSFRSLLLIVVFAAVCWGFWQNGQRRMEEIAMRGLFRDEPQALSPMEKAEVLRYLKTFKRDFGVPLTVRILDALPEDGADYDSGIRLDVVPSRGRAYLRMPPLVRNAVGADFVRDMETAFAQDFAGGNWRAGLVSAVLALRAKLGEVTR